MTQVIQWGTPSFVAKVNTELFGNTKKQYSILISKLQTAYYWWELLKQMLCIRWDLHTLS